MGASGGPGQAVTHSNTQSHHSSCRIEVLNVHHTVLHLPTLLYIIRTYTFCILKRYKNAQDEHIHFLCKLKVNADKDVSMDLDHKA